MLSLRSLAARVVSTQKSDGKSAQSARDEAMGLSGKKMRVLDPLPKDERGKVSLISVDNDRIVIARASALIKRPGDRLPCKDEVFLVQYDPGTPLTDPEEPASYLVFTKCEGPC